MNKMIRKALQRYWRLSRSLTVGAQGVVIDSQDRVLLIRHTYRPGWHFPGGGVEKNETVLTGLRRELAEEARVTIDATPELFGLYANFHHFPSDHIVLFIVRNWHQPVAPKPNHEIAEHGFFKPNALPDEIHPPTQRRLVEIFDNVPRAQMW
ncbi:MAG: NUDIX domain-containing protein [Hyphomicrobiaceae bacterium]